MIAYLGWGSLIWDPNGLPISGVWSEDGPLLPLEFARESGDGRLTLVITDNALPVPSLWCHADVPTFEEAQQELARREKIKPENITYSVGWWRSSDSKSHGKGADVIGAWAREKQLEAVLWTNLKFGFIKDLGNMISYEQALLHLQALTGEQRKKAEEYDRGAPEQVMTDYRRGFERDLGWGFQG